MAELNDLVTVGAIARELGTQYPVVRGWVVSGKVKSYGGLVSASEVRKYAAANYRPRKPHGPSTDTPKGSIIRSRVSRPGTMLSWVVRKRVAKVTEVHDDLIITQDVSDDSAAPFRPDSLVKLVEGKVVKLESPERLLRVIGEQWVKENHPLATNLMEWLRENAL